MVQQWHLLLFSALNQSAIDYMMGIFYREFLFILQGEIIVINRFKMISFFLYKCFKLDFINYIIQV